jgi:hypothetical protein
MPIISTFYGIIIQMYWHDHSPPHFHARYAEEQVVIDIHTLKILQGVYVTSRAGAGAGMGAGTS